DDIIVMNAGKVQDTGPPETIYLKPKNRFTAAFMGEANFITGRIVRTAGRSLQFRTDFGEFTIPQSALLTHEPEPGASLDLCFRPEHVRPDLRSRSAIDLGPAQITDMAFSGTCHRCHMRLKDQIITAHLPQNAAAGIGDTVRLKLDRGDVILLPHQEPL
ncbi:MAG: TOBE domain-containing protein, partial [Aestuariivirgaceae bacterium]